MLYLSSSLPSLTTNPPSLPRFVLDGLQRWSSVPRGHVSILDVLGCYSLPILVVGCSYFPEDLPSVLSKVCSLGIGLVPSIHILGFLSSHKYITLNMQLANYIYIFQLPKHLRYLFFPNLFPPSTFLNHEYLFLFPYIFLYLCMFSFYFSLN